MPLDLLITPLVGDITVTALQAIAVAFIVLIGQVAVARLSNKAQNRSTDVSSQEKATEAWQDYATEMKTRLDGLETRLNEAERRVRALETQTARDLDLISRLVRRLRAAWKCLEHLGESVPEEDKELADVADLRITAYNNLKE